jgi:hypothetical protein
MCEEDEFLKDTLVIVFEYSSGAAHLLSSYTEHFPEGIGNFARRSLGQGLIPGSHFTSS